MSSPVVLITGALTGIGRAAAVIVAQEEEIAHVIAFVASANASYMTGASIPVDGGMIAD
jgi:NAD(P)-dependent dehydrogenase (short-subunit alcohol dehydrogenase family)